MKKTIQYFNQPERKEYLEQNVDLFLVEERNIVDGNFLIFSDEKEHNFIFTNVPKEDFEVLQQENILLKAQNNALTERTDFHEEILTEIILTIAP